MAVAADSGVLRMLLVEDDAADIVIIQEALEAVLEHTLGVVGDGQQAMAYLRHEAGYEHVARPDVVLLDLNLPIKNGREVLAEVKSDPSLQMIPVVIVSTSNDEIDIAASYALHASAYMVKPVNFEQFARMVRCIAEFYAIAARVRDGAELPDGGDH